MKKIKRKTHAMAKIGKNLPRKRVYVRSIRGNNATISWSTGSDIVVAHIKKRHLK